MGTKPCGCEDYGDGSVVVCQTHQETLCQWCKGVMDGDPDDWYVDAGGDSWHQACHDRSDAEDTLHDGLRSVHAEVLDLYRTFRDECRKWSANAPGQQTDKLTAIAERALAALVIEDPAWTAKEIVEREA